ncbi:MAG: 3-keto-5-aminohexanoate cleavage protein [Chloroflexia bacterium]
MSTRSEDEVQSDRKVVISAAITGGMTTPTQSDAIPVTPEHIVTSAVEAHSAGAAIVHIHVRDPHTGRPSGDPDVFRKVLTGIKERCDAVVQTTTGGSAGDDDRGAGESAASFPSGVGHLQRRQHKFRCVSGWGARPAVRAVGA